MLCLNSIIKYRNQFQNRRITAWNNFFFLGQHWIIINNKLVNKANRWQSPETSANWTLSRDYEGSDKPEFKNTYSCKLKSYKEEKLAWDPADVPDTGPGFVTALTAEPLTGQGNL